MDDDKDKGNDKFVAVYAERNGDTKLRKEKATYNIRTQQRNNQERCDARAEKPNGFAMSDAMFSKEHIEVRYDDLQRTGT